MTLKVMVFIDGSWVFHNKGVICNAYNNPDFKIDYGKIPELIRKELEERTKLPIDIARVCYFGSIPINKPGFDPSSQKAFFDYLNNECHFDTEIYEIDFKNNASFSPQEKCVDIGLSSSMLFHAALPGTYDIAALVAGDYDYMPMLKKVRQLGKRTILVGLRKLGNVYPTSLKLIENYTLFDFHPIFLEDYLDEIQLVKNASFRICDSCGKREETEWEGRAFFCSDCRKKHKLLEHD